MKPVFKDLVAVCRPDELHRCSYLKRNEACREDKCPIWSGWLEPAEKLEQKMETPRRRLAKHQPCGCVICTCEDENQCQGCGAKHCGTHPRGQIPKLVYEKPPAAESAEGCTCPVVDRRTTPAFIDSNCPIHAKAESKTYYAIEQRLRLLLFAEHSCDTKYGDDGERQCGACGIDFLRDSVEEIERKTDARNYKRLRAFIEKEGK